MEFLELPQDLEVFLSLFTVFSPNAEGKTKKGYMSVWPGKGRKIFGLYEESFHDFKGRYFKVFAVGDHPPFWLTLEREAGRFLSYWSKDAGVNYVPTAYRKLNEEQRDTADILLWLFSQRVLKPKAILGNPERARVTIVKMARRRHWPTFAGQWWPTHRNVEGGTGNRPEVSSPIREEVPEHQVEIPPPPSPLGRRGAGEAASAQKRPRISKGSQRDFCPMDRSFDALGYIEANFLGPRAVEALRDYDPMESLRWAEWAMLRSATIMKSIEPRLILADQWEHRCTKLTGDLKLLNQQKADVEKEKEEAETAKSKAEKDLEAAMADAKEKGVELQRLRDSEVCWLTLSLPRRSSQKRSLGPIRRRLPWLQRSKLVKATEDALKEQILVLAPYFDVSLLGAWKEVVDGQIVDPPPEP
ncbi:hypothetical protein PIB30_008915 [Stylosanthes scabra]|uniref:Uncharacterized protein n=1 Tax=Stylosanthes scabra TaxID=79078 RepID=A0ABU6Q590_9FABA|nr:hypothetical protein [Stylosanthes scabra]